MLRVALIARGRNRYRRISSLVTPFSHISPRLREVHKFPVHAHPPPPSLSLSLSVYTTSSVQTGSTFRGTHGPRLTIT